MLRVPALTCNVAVSGRWRPSTHRKHTCAVGDSCICCLSSPWEPLVMWSSSRSDTKPVPDMCACFCLLVSRRSVTWKASSECGPCPSAYTGFPACTFCDWTPNVDDERSSSRVGEAPKVMLATAWHKSPHCGGINQLCILASGDEADVGAFATILVVSRACRK